MLSPRKEKGNKLLNTLNYKFKAGEFTPYFKQLYNEYLNHQKNKNLQLQLIYNPNKLFIDDIYQKKKELDLKQENMNILNDLFDGKKIDIDEQRYLNYNSKNGIRFQTQNTKISHYILFNTTEKSKLNKKKKIHKSFSQNLFSNSDNRKILPFPKIFSKETKKNDISPEKKNLTINTKTKEYLYNYKNNFKRQIRKEKKKTLVDLNIYLNNNFRRFNPYRTKYYNKMNFLTIETKKLAKNLSLFSLKRNQNV